MIAVLLSLLVACGGGEQKPAEPSATPAAPAAPAPAAPAVEVGPDGPTSIAVPSLDAVSTDAADIAAGEAIWGTRGCGGCHDFGKKVVGPDLSGLLTRRTLPWVERMVMEPEKMVKDDPTAKDLFKTHMVQMPKQGVTAEELPKLLAYLKSRGA